MSALFKQAVKVSGLWSLENSVYKMHSDDGEKHIHGNLP